MFHFHFDLNWWCCGESHRLNSNEFVKQIFSYQHPSCSEEKKRWTQKRKCNPYLNSVEYIWVLNWIMSFGRDGITARKKKQPSEYVACIEAIFSSHRAKTFITFVILGIFKLICSLCKCLFSTYLNGLFAQRWQIKR